MLFSLGVFGSGWKACSCERVFERIRARDEKRARRETGFVRRLEGQR